MKIKSKYHYFLAIAAVVSAAGQLQALTLGGTGNDTVNPSTGPTGTVIVAGNATVNGTVIVKPASLSSQTANAAGIGAWQGLDTQTGNANTTYDYTETGDGARVTQTTVGVLTDSAPGAKDNGGMLAPDGNVGAEVHTNGDVTLHQSQSDTNTYSYTIIKRFQKVSPGKSGTIPNPDAPGTFYNEGDKIAGTDENIAVAIQIDPFTNAPVTTGPNQPVIQNLSSIVGVGNVNPIDHDTNPLTPPILALNTAQMDAVVAALPTLPSWAQADILTKVEGVVEGGNLLVEGDARVVHDSSVGGDTQLDGKLNVDGATTTKGITNAGNIGTTTLGVTGLSTLAATTTTGLTNTGNIGTTTLGVTGLSTLAATTTTGLTNTGNIGTTTLGVSGNTTLGDDIDDATLVNGTLRVTSGAQIDGTLNVDGLTTTHGLTNLTGNLTNNGDTFLGNQITDITTISGDASVGRDLSVAGNSTVTGNSFVSGNTTLGNSSNDTTTINGILRANNGIDATGDKITNLASGTDRSDAVNLGQMQDADRRLRGDIEQNTRGIAMVAAMTNTTVEAGKTHGVDFNIAQFQDETGMSFGYANRINENLQIHAAAASTTDFDEAVARIGVSYQW